MAKRKKPPRRKRKLWRRVGVGLALLLLLVLAGGVYTLYREISTDLPPVDTLLRHRLPTATRVYAYDGSLLAEFFVEKRYVTPISQIPPLVRAAFIAAEDANFYRHRGIDLPGVIRAALANLVAGKIIQGGSTITQQVVKSMLLSPEKSYERKLKEMILAVKLERQLTKEEILYLYLNLIYLGNGAYGVAAAAQIYFDKELQDLTLAEAALLAGLPKAPSRYSPTKHFRRAKARQSYVLRQMAKERMISWSEAQEAYRQPLHFASRGGRSPRVAPYYVEHVRSLLEERYGETAPYQLGLQVYTALNPALQEQAERALREGLAAVSKSRGNPGRIRHLSPSEAEGFLAAAKRRPSTLKEKQVYEGLVTGWGTKGLEVAVGSARATLPLGANTRGLSVGDLIAVVAVGRQDGKYTVGLDDSPEVEGALVSLDLASGRVNALVGGYDFNRSQFNRATQARRQPGSAFKPIVYAAALDRGYTPATVILDEPISFRGPGRGQWWTPHNYENRFFGPTTLRDALTFSRNVVTVKIANGIGISYLNRYMMNFGLKAPSGKNLATALGSSEVSLLELARAYAVFATQGRLLEPIFITRITDNQGNLLFEQKPVFTRVIPPETAYMITNMLKDVIERGTGRRAKDLGRPAAGKTGTTNDMHDAWFVGYTPELLAGVWVGYDSKRSLGPDQTGGRVAAPIWVKYMQAALGDKPVSDFSIPAGITFATIDRRSGRRASAFDGDVILECFRRGTEPAAPRRAAGPNDETEGQEELERAIRRLRRGSYSEDWRSRRPSAPTRSSAERAYLPSGY